MNKYPKYHINQSQTGATLIVVLLFLLLIILVGTMAVRNSMTSLRLATSDQIDTLLLTASDNTNKNIENIINEPKYKDESAKLLGPLGFFGYFMSIGATSNRGDQVVFCYRPRESYFFNMSEATVLTSSNKSRLVGGADATGGFCQVTREEDFVNARQNVMTQVSVTRPNTVSVPISPFGHVPLGKTLTTEDITSTSPSFRIHSTSFLPAMSSASAGDITECLKKPSENATSFISGVKESNPDESTYYGETRNECLTKIGVPSKVVVGEVQLENMNVTEKCIKYGKGSGQISAKCQELLDISASGTPK
ncbi:PilX N-terminal domain-containing pilus assembly protein [Psychrobacter sp. CAL346-MNA-CIBAN-0220]|uniref:PilX N-terminal domain-containing pilus assembly protein n=1 Tax=Psychrobacter sp. CAL346-MNA-CIBAN-0220 TaxID=3140457 RepID=UPI0033189398